jgi:hypothetical protein
VLLATPKCLPPRAKFNSAGGPSDLESLKSGKDRTKLRCALKKRKTKRIFTAKLSRLPTYRLRSAAHQRRPPVFGTITLRRFRSRYLPSLHRPNHVRCCGL